MAESLIQSGYGMELEATFALSKSERHLRLISSQGYPKDKLTL